MNKIQYIELLKLRGITDLKDRSVGLSLNEAVKNSGGDPTIEEMVIVNENAMNYFLEKNLLMSKDIKKLTNENAKLTNENAKLIDDVAFLNCLEACGVDNWTGYSTACEMLEDT